MVVELESWMEKPTVEMMGAKLVVSKEPLLADSLVDKLDAIEVEYSVAWMVEISVVMRDK